MIFKKKGFFLRPGKHSLPWELWSHCEVGGVAEYHLEHQGRADVCESARAEVPALLHVPRASPENPCPFSLCAGMGRVTRVRKAQYFQGSSCLAVSSSQWESEHGGSVPDTIQGHRREEQAQTTLTVKAWLSCFLQVLGFSRIFSHYANSFSTHVLYMWLCATEVF